jgi:hypothetical protein
MCKPIVTPINVLDIAVQIISLKKSKQNRESGRLPRIINK